MKPLYPTLFAVMLLYSCGSGGNCNYKLVPVITYESSETMTETQYLTVMDIDLKDSNCIKSVQIEALSMLENQASGSQLVILKGISDTSGIVRPGKVFGTQKVANAALLHVVKRLDSKYMVSWDPNGSDSLTQYNLSRWTNLNLEH